MNKEKTVEIKNSFEELSERCPSNLVEVYDTIYDVYSSVAVAYNSKQSPMSFVVTESFKFTEIPLDDEHPSRQANIMSRLVSKSDADKRLSTKIAAFVRISFAEGVVLNKKDEDYSSDLTKSFKKQVEETGDFHHEKKQTYLLMNIHERDKLTLRIYDVIDDKNNMVISPKPIKEENIEFNEKFINVFK
jgi:hypothetical protein